MAWGVPVHVGIVFNRSRRPIADVECRIGAPGTDLPVTKTHSDLAVIVGRLTAPDTSGCDDPDLIDPIPRSRALRILPGQEYGFIFEIKSHWALGLVSGATASFTDDVGLRWQIDQYQHLERLPDSE